MSFFMAKCCTNTINNIVRVNVPRMKFDKMLNMHFRENDELMVRDVSGSCRMGDWILVKPMEIKKTIAADHEVFKVVYKHGNLICPLTGKRSYGYMFKEDQDRYKISKEAESEASKAKN